MAMKQNSDNVNSKTDVNVNKPPPLSQIHHSKINQRQDSNISSDSYSMISSPGYNSKTMETPLLKNATRMKKSKNFNYQSSADSFKMTNMNKNDVSSKRQDSGISSESISQTSSSSGFNSKLMDTPLLAHALKIPSRKYTFNKLTQ
jgi:atrial natriuretic peptide-converting enzyme